MKKTDDELRAELDRGANVTVLGPKAKGRANGQAVETAAAITPIRFPDLEGKDPPLRRFIVETLVPAGCNTALYGGPGIGKSMVAQQIATAVAVGRDLFGFRVEKGPVLGLMCEDDDDELWRRQVRINGWLGCRMADLGDLHLQGRAGLENILAIYPTTGAPTVEAFFEMIREKARALRPVLIILDPLAQLFGGNENDRFEATHFVNLVGGLAREFGCAVLLLGHPAKPKDSEYSGSTAWDASVRSRLLLQRKKDDDGNEGDELLLSRVKGNYAPPVALSLHWVGGVLRSADQRLMTPADRSDAETEAERARAAFLAALDRLNAQGRNVSHSKHAPNYAPKAMVAAGMGGGFGKRDLAGAMESLLGSGAILANEPVRKGKDRKPIHGLCRVAAAGESDAVAGRSDDPRGRTSAGGEARVGWSPPKGGDLPTRIPPAPDEPEPPRTLGTFPQPSRTTFPHETPPDGEGEADEEIDL